MNKKYYEIKEPYYALLKAKNKNEAISIYTGKICDTEDESLSSKIKEVDRDYAIAKYSRTLSEDGKEIPLEEILTCIKEDRSKLMIIDGELL